MVLQAKVVIGGKGTSGGLVKFSFFVHDKDLPKRVFALNFGMTVWEEIADKFPPGQTFLLTLTPED